MPAPDNNSYTYVQVVNNYYLLITGINNIINRLQGYVGPSPSENATVDIDLSPTPCCPPLTRELETATRSRDTEVPTMLVTITPTTCSVIPPELTTIVPLSRIFCTATPTLTPTITPSFTPITIYPTARPTRDRSDGDPPPPPPDACCKICGTNSKPCGDACISLEFTCHQPPGCACDG
jgi:hypothetical protein